MKNKLAFTLAEVLITLVVIGVVAALTIPTAISKYRKTTVETRLKNSYSTLVNVVKMSTIANGDISGWDYCTENFDEFLNKYIYPYVVNSKLSCKTTNSRYYCTISLSNGTMWYIERNPRDVSPETSSAEIQIIIDINGDAKPNEYGYDMFVFHIFPQAKAYYNAGNGDMAWRVPSPGVYYDGYGMDENRLRNNEHRGCSNTCNYWICRAYCTGLIVRNSWKIPDDYPISF